MFVNPKVTFDEVEQKLLIPYLLIQEQDMSEEERNKSLEKLGVSDSNMVGAGSRKNAKSVLSDFNSLIRD